MLIVPHSFFDVPTGMVKQNEVIWFESNENGTLVDKDNFIVNQNSPVRFP